MAGEAFYLLAGVCAIAILVVFILAIRLSYRIEARSPNLINRSGYSRKAMMLHTITNMKVARDPETLAMRRRMNGLLLIVLAGFAIMAAGLHLTRSAG